MTATAADRDELARCCYASRDEIAAMPDALVARLLEIARDRADDARDEAEER